MRFSSLRFFFFNDTATTEIYTLSLHDALPICHHHRRHAHGPVAQGGHRLFVLPGHSHADRRRRLQPLQGARRSEEHTSELQSLAYLVCRLLLEKKKKQLKDVVSTQG